MACDELPEKVSTHSRLKAAGRKKTNPPKLNLFQHTAA